jgi:hypothetical protein
MARMEWLRAHPAVTSAVGGLLVGAALLVFGTHERDLVALALATLLGVVLAVAMYVPMRRRPRG